MGAKRAAFGVLGDAGGDAAKVGDVTGNTSHALRRTTGSERLEQARAHA